MKRKNIRILQTIAMAAGLAATAAPASAAGQVGQRYLELTADGVFWDNDSGLEDGFGASLTYNQPLATSFDLGLGYSHLHSRIDLGEGAGEPIDGDLAFFSGTWFTPAANGKLYVRGAIAWADTDTGIGDDDEWLWELETGLEIPVGEKIAVTPYVSCSDGFDGNTDGVFDFGVKADFDVANRTSLILDLNINDDSDVGVSGGVVFRF